MKDCVWTHNNRKLKSKVTPNESLLQTKLVEQFVYWLFEKLLIPLIRNHFYVTDTAPYKNLLFYFRHDVWRGLTEQSLKHFSSNLFVKEKLVRFFFNF